MRNRSTASAAGLIIASALVASLNPHAAFADVADEGAVDVDVASTTVTIQASDVGIELPGEVSTSEVNTTKLPVSLFSETDSPLLNTTIEGSVISTFATGDGVQTLIEIPDADSPREYRFPLSIPEGGTSEFTADGGVLVKAADGMPVGGFKAPWALDADGRSVPTSFRIDGTDLVQTVNFSDETSFPVIADPDWGTEWWGRWMRLTKQETKNLAAASGDIQSWIGILSTACAAVPPLATACATIINVSALVHGQIVRDAAKKGLCVAINAPFTTPPPPHMTVVKCTR